MIVVPFSSLLLAVMASHFILGPVGWKIGSAVSAVVYSGITGSFKVVFGAVFGMIYAPLVITGLHHMSNAIDLQLIADYGGTMLWPMIALSNIAQGSAVMGMMALQRKNAEAQEVNVPACISCYLGVTEPAIFGVNLKQGFPFVWDDWFRYRGSGLCGYFYDSQCHRSRRIARDSFDSADFDDMFCCVYGNCDDSSFCFDNDCRKETDCVGRK